MDSTQPQSMALIIAEVPEAQLFILVNGNRTKLAEGSLNLAQIQESKTYFINIGKFCQNIVNGTPFVSITRPRGTTLLFPNIDQGLNGLFVPKGEAYDFMVSQLTSIVQIVPYEEAIQIQQIKETTDMHCKNIIEQPLEDDSNVVDYIAKGGEQNNSLNIISVLKSSFSWIGGAIATGINKGGDYLSSKVNRGEEVQVSDNTKSSYSNVKDKASSAFEITSNIFMQLYRPVAQKTKEVTQDISQKIDSSDNKLLQQGKQLTSATWGAAGAALSGLADGLSQVGTSLNQNTKQIVEKKYGQDVTKTFMGGATSDQQQSVELSQPLLDAQYQQQNDTLQSSDHVEQGGEDVHQKNHSGQPKQDI